MLNVDVKYSIVIHNRVNFKIIFSIYYLRTSIKSIKFKLFTVMRFSKKIIIKSKLNNMISFILEL